MFVEATDPDYHDRIHDGPFVPTKLVPEMMVDGRSIPEHYMVKDKIDWTKEEKTDVLKDAKETFCTIVQMLSCQTE